MNYVAYANQGATRNQPLSNELLNALSFLDEMGVQAKVFSGGQPGKGSGKPRVGSTRHDHGNAADVFFYKDGQRLDWAKPEHTPIFQEIVRRGKSAGLTGFGAGDNYMQPGSMHIGFGAPSVWGEGGKGANAPDWLRQAYGMAPTGNAPIATISTKGQEPMQQGGLMGMMGGQQAAPAMEPQMADGLLGMLFPQMTADRADKIRLGMLGATTRPNQAAISGIQQGMQARNAEGAEKRAQAQKMAQQQQQMAQEEKRRNRTADWLESQGFTQEAQLVRMGEMDGGDAFKMAKSTAAAANDPDVQSSAMLPDQSGTVMTMRDGSLRVVTVGGETISGQEAVDFVTKSQERAAELQRGIYGARREGTLGADIELGGEAERVAQEGKMAPVKADEYMKSAELVGSTIRNMESAIKAIDGGAESGIVYNMLPNITKASAELQNAKQRLGLDVIGSVTFGALSAAEMKIAMDTAVPQDLGPVELRAWLEEKAQAQRKAHQALIEASLHFARGGSMEDYVKMYSDQTSGSASDDDLLRKYGGQ